MSYDYILKLSIEIDNLKKRIIKDEDNGEYKRMTTNLIDLMKEFKLDNKN